MLRYARSPPQDSLLLAVGNAGCQWLRAGFLSEMCAQPKKAALPKVVPLLRQPVSSADYSKAPFPPGCSQFQSSACLGWGLCCHCAEAYLLPLPILLPSLLYREHSWKHSQWISCMQTSSSDRSQSLRTFTSLSSRRSARKGPQSSCFLGLVKVGTHIL